MTRDFPERDWKVFKELREVALGRLCDRILTEAKAEIERPGKSSHERYLALYQLINQRNRNVAEGFDGARRSTALMQIGIIQSMGLFTESELQRFSPETQQFIAALRV